MRDLSFALLADEDRFRVLALARWGGGGLLVRVHTRRTSSVRVGGGRKRGVSVLLSRWACALRES